ncbi:hypothetical protein [Blastococcus goldschmidtiae]|uniref:DUF4367 domain-containing protein n=1 Tax=Blastococcus goldschmidtiae TaxID=3075546 RepID=A0ABU2K319_9ACTN|nr:hypothetical protein [Blastococcus sp. DSM 46792]MDT0274577.1 hypothetical protein [Blastococcus sp. DSM 46792]
MSTDLRTDVTRAYADVTLADPLEQIVRRGRRIRRARRARQAAPALLVAAAVAVGVTVVREDESFGPPGPVELVDYSVPAFPLSFERLPAGLDGPHASLDPSFDEVGPGTAHAGWSDPADPDSGIGLSVRADGPGMDGADEVGDAEIAGEDATVYRSEVSGGADVFSVVWERTDDQWVGVTGSGRFGSEAAVVDLARGVVDRGFAVPLQVSLAPRGWVVVAYKMDRVLTLADPAGRPATEASARTLTVHLPPEPSAPADLPRDVGATDGRMDEVTVQGRPGYLLPTSEVWFLQASLADGTVFTLQAPLDLTPEQVVEVADGVGRS